MDPAEFICCFKDRIRVQINWHALCASGWEVNHQDLSIPDDAGRVFVPWYALATGEPCCWRDQGAQVQSIADVSLNPALCKKHGICDVSSPMPPVTLPAYDVHNRNVLLLDGNHRAVSAMRAGMPLALVLFEIHGPIAERVLPDLKHWGPGQPG